MKNEALWVVSATCGDYYCGCGIGHLVGVATSEEQAKQISDQACDAAHYWSDGRPFKLFYDVRIERFPLNEFVSRVIV